MIFSFSRFYYGGIDGNIINWTTCIGCLGLGKLSSDQLLMERFFFYFFIFIFIFIFTFIFTFIFILFFYFSIFLFSVYFPFFPSLFPSCAFFGIIYL